MTDLEKIFEMVKGASKVAFELHGRCPPMFLTLEPSLVIPALWQDLEGKSAMISMIKALFKEYNVQRYGFAFEAWIAMEDTPKDGVIDIAAVVPPSQRADRQEAILVMAEEKGLPTLQGMWPITRNKKGRGKIGKFKQPDNFEALGVFRNMLGTEILH